MKGEIEMVNGTVEILFWNMVLAVVVIMVALLGVHIGRTSTRKEAIEAGVAYEEYNYKERTLEFKWKKLEKKDG